MTDDQIEIQARIINETDTAYLVTQRPFGGRNGVWLPKAGVIVVDRNGVMAHHTVRLPADMAAKKGLGPKMQESRAAPSPYGGTDHA